MSRVLVTGGTGVLGRALVQKLIREGHDVRVLSRRNSPEVPDFAHATRGDLETGAGLDAAVKGADAIVHCATSPSRMTREIDVEGTRRLLAAAKRAGAPHFVYVSLVGADESALPYHEAKIEAERLVRESGLPWSILRSTEFHDLLFSMLERESWLPVLVVPKGFRFQPVDAKDVAARLAAIVENGPVGRDADIGGPEVFGAEDLAKRYLEASNRRKPVVSLPFPVAFGRLFKEGANLSPAHREGTLGWEGYLSTHLRTPDARPEREEKRTRDVRFA